MHAREKILIPVLLSLFLSASCVENKKVAERQLSSCVKYTANRFAHCLDEAGKDIEAVLMMGAMAARGDSDAQAYLDNLSQSIDFVAYMERGAEVESNEKD